MIVIQDFLLTEKGLRNEDGGRGWRWWNPNWNFHLFLRDKVTYFRSYPTSCIDLMFCESTKLLIDIDGHPLLINNFHHQILLSKFNLINWRLIFDNSKPCFRDTPRHMYVNICRKSSVGLIQKYFASISETRFEMNRRSHKRCF